MRTVIAVVLTTLLAGNASADPAAADAEIRQAETLASAGDFVGAAAHYKLAYAADARPELICNAGVAYYKAQDATRAHLYLSRCQERGTALDAQFVSAVRTALAAVEAMLRAGAFTPVDVVAKPDGATIVVSTLGDADAIVGSRLLWLTRGKHTLTVHAEGYVDRTVEIDAQGRERQPVEVTLERSPATTTTTTTATPTTTTLPTTTTPPTPLTPAPGTRIVETPSKVPAIVATSATAAAFLVAALAYRAAHARADEAEFALSFETWQSDRDAVATRNATFGAALAFGLVGAGISGYLWYRAFRSPAAIEVDATTSAGSVTFNARW